MSPGGWGIAGLALWAVARGRGRRRLREDRERGWAERLGDPRNAVLVLLAAAAMVGGGRRWLQVRRARRAVERLERLDVSPEEVEAAAEHGREALVDLFRLLGTAQDPTLRDAAGHALAALWARDQLIAEEEKAIVRRGFAVTWRARRRYPRAMTVPIPIAVEYGVPFLRQCEGEVGPAGLEWSHRIAGADRMDLEQSSPWSPGPGQATFSIEPGDYRARGPHRLALQARARTRGLTSSWELDLPHMPFSFEFDPDLAVEALLTLPDDARAAVFARAVRLDRPEATEDEPRFLPLNDDLALRDPPDLAIATPLPCDLAHRVQVEFEGLPGRFAAGEVVLSGQGTRADEPPSLQRFPLGPIAGLPADAIGRPGERRMRALLTADPELGWADPDVRSIWPGPITTEWAEVRVIRR
jgi:hypothetical protein